MRALLLVAVLFGVASMACGGGGAPDTAMNPWVSPHTIVGEDDRIRITDTTVFPWRTIAYLRLYNDSTGEVGQCTGTFIGPDTILTAAHCLWSSERGWVDRIRVVPGKNGQDEPFGSEWASGFWVPDAWIDAGEPPLRDWGVVALPNARLGQQTGWLTVSVLSDERLSAEESNPAIVGYHGDVSPQGSLWGHFADAFVAVQNSNLLYDIDATRGSSGSPILFINAQGDRVVVGIHAYGLNLGESEGYNFGSRITGAVLADVQAGCAVLGCSISWENEEGTASLTAPPTATATASPDTPAQEPTATPTPSTPRPKPTPTEASRISQFVEWQATNWNIVNDDLNDLWEEWRVIADVTSVPSGLLYNIARNLDSRARSFLSDILLMAGGNRDIDSTIFVTFTDSIITYWEAYIEYIEAQRNYVGGDCVSPGGEFRPGIHDNSWCSWGNKAAGHRALIAHRLSVRNNAYSEHTRAACDLFRQQRYSNADEVCAQVDK